MDKAKEPEVAKLREEEKRLVDKINACKPNASGILQMEGAITVCEDEVDWLVITFREREELGRVRRRIEFLTFQ